MQSMHTGITTVTTADAARYCHFSKKSKPMLILIIHSSADFIDSTEHSMCMKKRQCMALHGVRHMRTALQAPTCFG